MRPLIVTARLAVEAQARLDALRERFFPPERSYVGAHLTLLHHLPECQSEALSAWLDDACRVSSFDAQFKGLKAWKTGFAAQVDCPALVALHGALVAAFRVHLSPQDTGKLWPHVTLQNKTPARQSAQDLLDARRAFTLETTRIVALDVWAYEGGPWTHLWGQPFSDGIGM